MIELKIDLNKRRQTRLIVLTEVKEGLLIESTTSAKVHVSVRVISPQGELVGEIIHGHWKFPTVIQIDNRGSTINANPVTLSDGAYRFDVFLMKTEESEATESTPYVKLTIKTGSTPRLLGLAYHIKPSETWDNSVADVMESISDGNAKYYRGDLHGHTTFSDGNLMPNEAVSLIDDIGLDYMALTEHNRMAFGYPKGKALLIPSFELTLPRGHMNLIGTNLPLHADIVEELTSADSIMDSLRRVLTASGTICSINHPFLKPWDYSLPHVNISDVDTLEIICDPTYPDSPLANQRAVAFLDWLWESGYKLFGVGGSDAHNRLDDWYEGADRPSVYGDPSTYVFCDGLTVKNLKQGLRNGNIYVSRGLNLEIQIDGGKQLPGNKVQESISSYVIAIDWKRASELSGHVIGKFIYCGRVIQEEVLSVDSQVFSLKTPVEFREGTEWLRAGFYDLNGNVIGYVNPVYSSKRPLRDGDVLTLIKRFEKESSQ